MKDFKRAFVPPPPSRDYLLTHINQPDLIPSNFPPTLLGNETVPDYKKDQPYIMATSDLDQLVMMGFDKERSEMALKASGGRKRTCSLPSFID